MSPMAPALILFLALLIIPTPAPSQIAPIPGFRGFDDAALVDAHAALADVASSFDAGAVFSSSGFDAASLAASMLPTPSDLSDSCNSVMQSILLGFMLDPKFLTKHPGILNMFDSFGRPRHGFLLGAMQLIGGFDECLNVSLAMKDVESNATRYCLFPFDAGDSSKMVQGSSGPKAQVKSSWGTCFPAVCNDSDAFILANTAWKAALKAAASKAPQLALFSNVTLAPGKCQVSASDPPALEWFDFVFLVVFGVIFALTLFATLYDYIFLDLKVQDWGRNTFVTLDESGEDDLRATTMTTTPIHPLLKFLLCFSALTNGRKILSLAATRDSDVACINGIRFISLTWVIMGHAYGLLIGIVQNIAYGFVTMSTRISFQPILNGTFSVDTFFVLSGFLTAYLFFKRFGGKETPARSIPKTVGKMYLHRYLRLTPSVAFLMMVYVTLIPMMSSGPFGGGISTKGTCSKWWMNMLYINNMDQDAMNCVGHVWYLANDMQFFILSPLFLFALKFHRILGFAVVGLFWSASLAATFAIAYVNDASALTLGLTDTMQIIYVKPWCRIGPYLAGIVAGYFLYEFQRDKRRIRWWWSLCGWALSAALALAVIYGLTDYDVNMTSPAKAANVIYLTFTRSVWGIAVSWVIFACALGSGGPINTALSWILFAPLSRVNYAAYLYHILVLVVVAQNMRDTFVFSDAIYVCVYLGLLLLSYGVAFVASVVFESPFIAMEKLVF